ncbi:MAG: NADH dehydrogenase I subunit B [Candidatus Brocadia fulgida]|uniref:NADH dehydrogenase I subunit B n=1 Tax=Candidatus Brocadia fulgida TaxID=380242 RepID=A0A0M2UQ60_9BACT|nr:MAG: NADH dehydrogenase I subunit B [Candidatus Brocadia fulgida]
MGLESHLGDNVLTTTLTTMVNWARKSSLWPMPSGWPVVP